VTLTVGKNAIAFEKEIYAYSGLVDFSAGSTGDERIGLDFTSPNAYYKCDLAISIDSGSWAANDILGTIMRLNGQNIYLNKFAITATTLGQAQLVSPFSVILPPNTRVKFIFQFSSGTAMVGSGAVVLTGREIGRA